MLLIGIVKKNAIMMIDFALEAERDQGSRPREAIYQACLLRFRPIMMTTLAALLGGLPLALGTGTGSELRRPLGITIVGGLLISQVLTLFTTPVIYLYMERLAAPGCDTKSRSDRRAAPRSPQCRGARAPGAAPRQPMNISEPSSAGRSPPRCWRRRSCSRGSAAYRCCRSRRCPASTSPPSRSAASLPGASPETMASSVATPLERRFGRIAGLAEITSIELARLDLDHAPVRPRARRRRRRARRAGRHQRRRRRAAPQPADAARPTARSTRPTRRS